MILFYSGNFNKLCCFCIILFYTHKCKLHQMKILGLFVGYPGSVHDSRVFRNSSLCQNLVESRGRYYLLADSGYPLIDNLLTPFKDQTLEK